MSTRAIATTEQTGAPVEKLAQFFQGCTRVRIPVRIARIPRQGGGFSEADGVEDTVIEHGTADVVIFASQLALDFEDEINLRNSDGTLEAEATVIAVQYGEGKYAVAARFKSPVRNWIIQAR